MSESQSTAGVVPPQTPGQDACPTPLAWQDVIAGVQREASHYHFSSGNVNLEGVQLGEGPPLWFLGGFTGDWKQFSLLAWLLKDRFRCFLCDLEWRRNVPAPAQVPVDLAHLLQRANLGLPYNVFATSFGSLVALSLLNRPDMTCQAAILHAGFARRRYSLTERLLARLGTWSSQTIGEFGAWRRIQESNHRTWFPPIDPGRWEFLRDNLSQTPVKELSLRVRAAAATNLAPSLEQIRVPVQLVRTEGDGHRLKEAQDELAEHLPNVREETLHTSGHYAFVSHPHRVAKVVKAFLDDVGSGREM